MEEGRGGINVREGKERRERWRCGGGWHGGKVKKNEKRRKKKEKKVTMESGFLSVFPLFFVRL